MTGGAWTDDDRTVEFDEELLVQPVRDDSGWGDSGRGEEATDDERLLDDRPPHWG